MKKITESLKSLKNSLSRLLNKYTNEIFVFAATSVAAFFVIITLNIANVVEKTSLMKINGDLMIENSFLKYKEKHQTFLLNIQEIEIKELRRFKEAILKGNYTQNENKTLRQRDVKMVEQSKRYNLGL